MAQGLAAAEYSDALIYLPLALTLLARPLGSEDADLLQQVAWCLRCWFSRLNEDGLREIIKQQWLQILVSCEGNVATLDELLSEERSTTCKVEPLDTFLDALIDPSVDRDNKFFQEVFLAWMNISESPSYSLSVLDFLLRVRNTRSNRLVYRAPVVLNAAFSQDLIQRHLESASEELQRRWGDYAKRKVEGELHIY